eukprot:s1179_g18.t1
MQYCTHAHEQQLSSSMFGRGIFPEALRWRSPHLLAGQPCIKAALRTDNSWNPPPRRLTACCILFVPSARRGLRNYRAACKSLGDKRSEATAEAVEAQAARVFLEAAGLQKAEAAASVRWFLENLRRSSTADWRKVFKDWVQRRAKGEPVQYILGSWPFHPLPIELLVRPPVLIPRPETEELVDRIIKHYGNCHPRRLVDFGSGSGAIVLSLLHAFPMATAVAVDPSEDAVALTRANAERCGVENRLEVRHASSKDWASTCSKAFDLIVSNPPYIPSHEIPGLQVDVREFEDHGALDGGSDGLSVITEVLCSARQVGLPGARIYLEVHHTHPALFERFSDEESHSGLFASMEGLDLLDTVSDAFGQPRFVELQVASSSKSERL